MANEAFHPDLVATLRLRVESSGSWGRPLTLTYRMRLVLDTNIWLDWLVFDDPSVRTLKAASQDGAVEICIDPPCLDELRRVLAYPEFGLELSGREAILDFVRGQTVSVAAAADGSETSLPRCTDPDDQKFLELAQRSKADFLLSRDLSLLRFGSKRRKLPFAVCTPSDWEAARNRGPVPVNPTR